MINRLHKPQRMCIVCKGRYFQFELTRLQVRDSNLVEYKGFNRSFYICEQCSKLDKTPYVISSRFKIDREKTTEQLKEILVNAKNQG